MADDTIDDAIVSVLESKHANQERLFRALETRYEVNLRRKKERKIMATKKKAKHAAKKAASKKRVAKKKRVEKKASSKRVRDKDGLLKGGSEAKVLGLIRRKTGASVSAICERLNMKPATVRVTVRNLRGKDFKIRTGDDGKYHTG